MTNIFSTTLIVVCLGLTSCIVSKKKFDDVLAQKVKTEGDLADKNAELDKAKWRIDSLSNTAKKLVQDTVYLTDKVKTTSTRLDGLNKDYDQLNSYYKNLLNSSGKLNKDMSQQKEQLISIQNKPLWPRRK